MRRFVARCGTTAVLLAVCAALVPESSPARAGALGVRLRRTSIFNTENSRWIYVRLPRRVPISKFRGSIEGTGRVGGFQLVKVGGKPGVDATALNLSTGRCRRRGCRGRISSGWTFFIDMRSGREYLPRGVYRLYVIADSNPLRVVLRFSNLAGRVVRQPRRRFPIETRTFATRYTAGGLDNPYSAGGFAALGDGTPHFGFTALWLKTADPSGVTFGECLYYPDGPEPPSDETAFAPGCPRGDSEPAFAISEATSLEIGAFDAYGVGGWFTTTAPEVERFGAIGMWMNFVGS